MGTINVMVGEILVDGKVSKRTLVEIQNNKKLIEIAKEQASDLSSKEKAQFIEDYQEGKYDYGDDEILETGGLSALDILRTKNVALTRKKKEKLIGSLTLDEKRFYGAWLNENENTANIINELDDELKFGKKTFQDGVEVFTNNKY